MLILPECIEKTIKMSEALYFTKHWDFYRANTFCILLCLALHFAPARNKWNVALPAHARAPTTSLPLCSSVRARNQKMRKMRTRHFSRPLLFSKTKTSEAKRFFSGFQLFSSEHLFCFFSNFKNFLHFLFVVVVCFVVVECLCDVWQIFHAWSVRFGWRCAKNCFLANLQAKKKKKRNGSNKAKNEPQNWFLSDFSKAFE